GRLVEQEDRRRVGGEHAAHALQDLTQQPHSVRLAEARPDDLLDVAEAGPYVAPSLIARGGGHARTLQLWGWETWEPGAPPGSPRAYPPCPVVHGRPPSAIRGGHPTTQSSSHRFPPETSQIAAARDFVRGQMRAWGLNGESDDLGLITSEMVTNAIVHGEGS